MSARHPSRKIDLDDFASIATADRTDLMHERFPSTATLQWDKAFANDPDLLGRVLRDILKLGATPAGPRHGPRPDLDPVTDGAALDRLRGLDPARHPYSLLPFVEALAILTGTRSVRHVARLVGLEVTRVHRLRRGTTDPTMADMEHIAGAFDHQPSYFVEYRVRSIQTALVVELDRRAADSIRYYESLWNQTYRAG